MAWDLPPLTLILGPDEVHVWRAALDQTASCVRSLWQTLAMDERARAERFRFQKDREHFIVARGLLRALLGRYLAMEPSQLRFSYSLHGKPALAWDSGGDGLRFNVSHSHRLALFAISYGRELGIDVERIRAGVASEQTAERFFSPSEVAVLCSLPSHLRTTAFFHCWTRKEAYIKARGEGLSLHLDQFAVSLAPGEPPALLSTQQGPHEAWRWSLQELNPGPGYVAALAVEGHHWKLRCWQWPGV
jgi:4'-phosphopantetheinyl transferase